MNDSASYFKFSFIYVIKPTLYTLGNKLLSVIMGYIFRDVITNIAAKLCIQTVNKIM